jgi:hypothetical protein
VPEQGEELTKMGMGFSGAYAEVIEPDKLQSLVPDVWKKLKGLLSEDVKDESMEMTVLAYLWMPDNYGLDIVDPEWLNESSNLLNDEDDTIVDQRIAEYDQAFDELRKAFTDATAVGDSKLELDMGYHDCDAVGDRYDEVNGPYFCVDGCYAVTPAAKQLIEDRVIERCWFVVLC